MNSHEEINNKVEYEERKDSIDEYIKWHQEVTKEKLDEKLKRWYETTTKEIIEKERSFFSATIEELLSEWQSQYSFDKKGYDLLIVKQVRLVPKPYESVVNKLYRKNHDLFLGKSTKHPIIKFQECFERLNDTVRGLIVLKYLDGVDYLAAKIVQLGIEKGITVDISKEARSEGYFAQHLYYNMPITTSDMSWNEFKTNVKIEIQLTTQLQDVIRKLTHKQYEVRRVTMQKPDYKNPWQWNYKNDDFFQNSLGHMIHYLEGMILEVRDNKCKGDA